MADGLFSKPSSFSLHIEQDADCTLIGTAITSIAKTTEPRVDSSEYGSVIASSLAALGP